MFASCVILRLRVLSDVVLFERVRMMPLGVARVKQDVFTEKGAI